MLCACSPVSEISISSGATSCRFASPTVLYTKLGWAKLTFLSASTCSITSSIFASSGISATTTVPCWSLDSITSSVTSTSIPFNASSAFSCIFSDFASEVPASSYTTMISSDTAISVSAILPLSEAASEGEGAFLNESFSGSTNISGEAIASSSGTAANVKHNTAVNPAQINFKGKL